MEGGVEQACGQEQDGAKGGEEGLDDEGQQAEGQGDKPEDGERHQDENRQRPAEYEQDTPENQDQQPTHFHTSVKSTPASGVLSRVAFWGIRGSLRDSRGSEIHYNHSMSAINPSEDDLPAEELAAYQPLDAEGEYAGEGVEGGAGGGDPFEDGPIVEEPRDTASPPRPTEGDGERLARLREKAKALPECPGVYLMKDLRGVVLYVGKSRCLRDRVGSYFVPSADLGPGKQRLLEYVSDFDFLTCDTEVEALLTENRLIKDIHPRFNSMLMDDKSYPYLEITSREDYPGVYITRQPKAGGTKLYGPFVSSYGLRGDTLFAAGVSVPDVPSGDPRIGRASGFSGRVCCMRFTGAAGRAGTGFRGKSIGRTLSG